MNVKETTYPVMHIIINFIKTIQLVIDCLCLGFSKCKEQYIHHTGRIVAFLELEKHRNEKTL